ncbi:hypothetical protein AB0M02_39200 [Actinoplanes sp. NPDC051861]|uniref:hypothetical protein n=1 Tax=Actinoplanes sp. NPDC051861 TaxID=3155170 RepID=UPI0034438DD7
MEPVTLVVSALAAGALAGAGDTAATAVKDAYTALKTAVAKKFSGKPAAEVVLAEHADDPDTYEKPLAKHLQQAGADTDPRIVELATALLDAMKDQGSLPGKYQVTLENAKGVQVGDGNIQHNTF